MNPADAKAALDAAEAKVAAAEADKALTRKRTERIKVETFEC